MASSATFKVDDYVATLIDQVRRGVDKVDPSVLRVRRARITDTIGTRFIKGRGFFGKSKTDENYQQTVLEIEFDFLTEQEKVLMERFGDERKKE